MGIKEGDKTGLSSSWLSWSAKVTRTQCNMLMGTMLHLNALLYLIRYIVASFDIDQVRAPFGLEVCM